MNSLTKIIKRIRDSEDFSPPEKAEALRQAEATYAKNNLYYLAKHVLGYVDITEHYHLPICSALNRYHDDWQLHLHPRNHFKSTIITISESIQEILLNPDITILIANAVLGKAQAFLREIKSHFLRNDKFRELFPEHCPKTLAEAGTQDTFTTRARQKEWIREGSIDVTGIDKAVVSAHYDKIVFDDIVGPENVTTELLRRKIQDKYSEYLSLLNPPGLVRIVGTRWHYYDLYGWLLERKEKDPDFDYRIFFTQAYKKAEDGTEVPSFPERFDRKALNKLKSNQGTYIFSCQYLNDPQPEEDKVFSRANVRYAPHPKRPPETRLFTYSSCDPSVSDGPRSDPAVIVTICVNCNKEIYVKRIVRGWWNPLELINNCLTVCELDDPIKFGFESVAFQKTLKFFLEEARRERNIYTPIEEVKRKSGQKAITKAQRIERIEPYLKNNVLYVCDNPEDLQEETKQFLLELDTFPLGKHDDILDALSDCIELMRVPPKKKSFKVEYKYRDPSIPFRTGRNFQVGNNLSARYG